VYTLMAGQLTLKNLVGFGMAYVFVMGVGIIDLVLFGDWLTPWIVFVLIVGVIGLILQYEIYINERFGLDTYMRGYSTLFVLSATTELIGHFVLDFKEATSVNQILVPYLLVLIITGILYFFETRIDKAEQKVENLES
jgi:hypothetical protein